MNKNLVIADIRPLFKGNVIAPEDAEYDAARVVFYGGVEYRPSVIVRVANTMDVVAAINLARETGSSVAIRSGGHGLVWSSTNAGGILIDLHDMKTVEINDTEETAWAETGLTATELTKELDAHDFVLGFGDTGSVGIGGITLGGGVGYLGRKFGLTIDSVLAVDIVTADGQFLTVDPNNHPDLFWAIRGGGGNFGVVTRFKYRLHKLSAAYGGMLFLPADPTVLAGFMEAAEKAPRELSSILNVMPAPPMPFLPSQYHGKLLMMAIMVYAGETEAAEKALAPFRALATPLIDLLKPMRYREIYPSEEGEYHPLAVSQTMFIKSVDQGVAEKIIKHLNESTASMRAVQLRTLGGAIADVPAEATAYAHRNSKIMVNVAAFYETPENKVEREAWVAMVAKELYQGDDGKYVNFISSENESELHSAYPAIVWDRLVNVKKQYDPKNLFRANHNISTELT